MVETLKLFIQIISWPHWQMANCGVTVHTDCSSCGQLIKLFALKSVNNYKKALKLSAK